ncbi:LysM peptidoglycan-binding domain-containing protein [Methylophaga sp. OBS4]|uniref:LysM peptidoglycan-binding domain-containing protein n=1 Tax=Methylophaga sp. OBS4 TaxID=2991935 RepID=UPI002255215C|nr:LysM peptidoglycan-binding domain-containing protein [Methylophaga sp. OBS4]MCX4186579.1 LysM peptidoglycan-binding domain-containing protein [Methylophaga sp. OBS4]
MIRRIVFSLFFVLLSLPLVANEVELNPDHPQRYTVVKGDTLWDISGMFLRYPWHWPDIWYVNPQIENPHLIYPGDELTLVYRDGQPMLELSRGKRTVKLSPQVRETMLDKAIPTIPLSAIRPFLTKPRVVGAEVMETAPYVVASADERLISGSGDYVYARGINENQAETYSVFHGGEVYVDPETNEVLGYEAIYTGDASLAAAGDPAKMDLTYTNREVQIGDRLLEVEEEDFDLNFIPRSPEQDLHGRIISVFDGVSQVGQYQIVVLNLGTRDGLESGHVLSVFQAGETIEDQVTADRKDTVTLPDEHAGEAMVFKLYEKVSYAIVMKATRAIHLYDKVNSAP